MIFVSIVGLSSDCKSFLPFPIISKVYKKEYLSFILLSAENSRLAVAFFSSS